MRRALASGFVLLLGCSDPLKDVEQVTDTRVLAARVEVLGEPERASLSAGESAAVRWLVASPELAPAFSWELFACAAGRSAASLPMCADVPFAIAAGNAAADSEPRLSFTVPADTEAPVLALGGVVCPEGEPVLGADGYGCSEGLGTVVSLDLALAEAEPNMNPSIDGEALLFDGAGWPAGLDCASLPVVSAGSAHELELRLDDGDRDALEQIYSVDPARETLQVSHFSTGGELERGFTVLDADVSELVARVAFRAPDQPPDGGLVRFFFVVRDLRGGSDWVERAVCITP